MPKYYSENHVQLVSSAMALCRLFFSHRRNDYHDYVEEFVDLDSPWSRYNYDSCILDYHFDYRVNKLHKNSLCPLRIDLPSLVVWLSRQLLFMARRMFMISWLRLTVGFWRQTLIDRLFAIVLGEYGIFGFLLCFLFSKFPNLLNLKGSKRHLLVPYRRMKRCKRRSKFKIKHSLIAGSE